MPKFTPKTLKTFSIEDAGSPTGTFRALLLSDSGGLTQFGAFVETLDPGSVSSIKHWHANEDELVYMLNGVALVHEGDESYELHPGEVATFKAGVPQGHFIENTTESEISYLLIGTRSEGDRVTYPENNRIYDFERDVSKNEITSRRYTTLDGQPANSPYENKES